LDTHRPEDPDLEIRIIRETPFSGKGPGTGGLSKYDEAAKILCVPVRTGVPQQDVSRVPLFEEAYRCCDKTRGWRVHGLCRCIPSKMIANSIFVISLINKKRAVYRQEPAAGVEEERDSVQEGHVQMVNFVTRRFPAVFP